MTQSNASTAHQQRLSEVFAKAFAAFVARIDAAVTEGILNPAVSSTPGFLMWQTEALPRLQNENAQVQNALASLRSGQGDSISKIARYQLGLAAHLDGFPLDFAGPHHIKALDELMTSVVVAAYQLSAAGGTL